MCDNNDQLLLYCIILDTQLLHELVRRRLNGERLQLHMFPWGGSHKDNGIVGDQCNKDHICARHLVSDQSLTGPPHYKQDEPVEQHEI